MNEINEWDISRKYLGDRDKLSDKYFEISSLLAGMLFHLKNYNSYSYEGFLKDMGYVEVKNELV